MRVATRIWSISELARYLPGAIWQVLGRNKDDVTFNDSIILDLYYIQNYSFWLDLRILLKTISVVWQGHGAY